MPSNRLQQNPLVLWICLMGGVISLAVLSIGLFALAPNSMGLTEQDYAISSAFAFDEWEISTRHGYVSFPEGGLAVEAYKHDRLAAFVVWGKACLSVTPPEQATTELDDIQITAIFLPEKELLSARGSTFIRCTDSPDACQQASEFLNNEQRYLPTLEIFGTRRSYPLPSGVAKLVMLDSNGQRFAYQEGLVVRLQGPNSPQSFWSETTFLQHLLSIDSFSSMVFYICCILLLLTATYFSTLGRKLDNKMSSALAEGKTASLLICLAIASLHALGTGLIARLELSPLVRTTQDALLISLLVYWLNRQSPEWVSWMEQKRHLPFRQVGLGLILGGLAVTLGQLAIPTGLRPLPLGDYLVITGGGLIAVLAQELLWHGVVLEHLATRLGNLRGLLLTAGLQGLLAFAIWLLHPVSALGPLNTLVIVPLQSIWLGYTYLRTNCLVTPSTIGACLVIFPRILSF